jgi:outer membrane protein TolC
VGALACLLPPRHAQAQSEATQVTAAGGSAEALGREQAIQRALEENPSCAATQIDVESAKQQTRIEQERYPYLLVGDAGFTRSEQPQLRADDSVAASVTRSLDASIGVRRTFPFGTIAEVRATNQYYESDTGAVTVSPFQPAPSGHAATLRASVTQPLLRGFGSKVGEVDLRAARVNEGIAQRGLIRARSELVRDVSAAYFELWYAERAVELEQSSLALARKQVEQTTQRVELGELSTTELLTFQTRSAELEESLVSAQLAVQQRSTSLAQLMGADPGTSLHATDDPTASSSDVSAVELRDAIAQRSEEIAELQERVRLARVRAEVAGDSARPSLDAAAYVQSNGVSQQLPNAWQRAAGLQWWSTHVGLSLELPLTDDRRQAQLAQAQLDVAQAQTQLRAARERIAAQAQTAVFGMQAARERIATSSRTLAIAAKSHEAAQARYELGESAAIAVQQAEEDLRRARLRVLNAQVDLAQQQLVLEHLTGGLAVRAQR